MPEWDKRDLTPKEIYDLQEQGIDPFTGKKYVDIDLNLDWQDRMNDSRNPVTEYYEDEVDRLKEQIRKLEQEQHNIDDSTWEERN